MRYRTVDVRMWGDEKFRALSPIKPSGQGLWLYLLTNPNTNSIPGIYRIGELALAEELNWTLESFREAFREVLNQGLVQADFCARVIYIPNAIKYNKPQSPNVVKSWRMHWDEIPECALKTEAYQGFKAFMEGLGKGFQEAFAKAFDKPSGKTKANQEQEQEQNIKTITQNASCAVDNFKKNLALRFDDFWNSYPRKKDRRRAQTTWEKKSLDDIADLIIADVRKRSQLDRTWKEKEFIPYPATYLAGERWEDEITLTEKEITIPRGRDFTAERLEREAKEKLKCSAST